MAWVFLGGLILTGLAGLAFYLLLPLWENMVGARKATFEATLSMIAAEDSVLDDDRKALINRDGETGVSPWLVQLLRGQWERLNVPGSQTVRLEGSTPAPGGGLLVYGDESTLLRSTDQWSSKVETFGLASGRDGYATLEAFLDTELPAHIRERPPFIALRDELTNLQNRRDALAVVAAGVEARIRELDGLPYAGWRRDHLRFAFETFLATRRGDASPDADLTTACVDAWQAQEEAAVSWWRTLSEQVPPGILILFLLATTVSLYR